MCPLLALKQLWHQEHMDPVSLYPVFFLQGCNQLSSISWWETLHWIKRHGSSQHCFSLFPQALHVFCVEWHVWTTQSCFLQTNTLWSPATILLGHVGLSTVWTDIHTHTCIWYSCCRFEVIFITPVSRKLPSMLLQLVQTQGESVGNRPDKLWLPRQTWNWKNAKDLN